MIAKCVALFVVVFLHYVPQPKPAFELTSTERQIIERTNAERKARGLTPLAVDPRLMRSAREHVKWMAESDSLTHTNQAVAENIAWNQSSPVDAVRAWMNSSGHRANLLGGYSRIGVGCARAADGSLYWCQQFVDGTPN